MSMPIDSSAPSSLQCDKCGVSLPDVAQYCMKCGAAITPLIKEIPSSEVAKAEIPPKSYVANPKRHLFRWLFLALPLIAILWVAASDNPYAQGIQEFVGWKHDEALLDNSFSIAPHSFQYYKFVLPQASTNVFIVGQFATSTGGGTHKQPVGSSETGVEVYVLSESAFAIWQKGYATGSVYESDRVDSGKIQAALPAGAGVYYLIFSNRFSAKTGKKVDASALLRYKSWLPSWIRGLKNDISEWLGL